MILNLNPARCLYTVFGVILILCFLFEINKRLHEAVLSFVALSNMCLLCNIIQLQCTLKNIHIYMYGERRALYICHKQTVVC